MSLDLTQHARSWGPTESVAADWVRNLCQLSGVDRALESLLGYLLDSDPAFSPFSPDPVLSEDVLERLQDEVETRASLWLEEGTWNESPNGVTFLITQFRNRLDRMPRTCKLGERLFEHCRSALNTRSYGRPPGQPLDDSVFMRGTALRLAAVKIKIARGGADDDGWQQLHPLLLDVALVPNLSSSLQLAHEYTEALRLAPTQERTSTGESLNIREKIRKLNDHRLAPLLRIIQWEVLTLDRPTPEVNWRLSYQTGTTQKEIDGIISPEFHLDLADHSWSVSPDELPPWCELTSPCGFGNAAVFDQDGRFEKSRHQIKEILSNVSERFSWSHRDLVETFRRRRIARIDEGQVGVGTLLLEDGELSFFSLLWYLRRLRRLDSKSNWADSNWADDPDRKYQLCFDPSSSSETAWTDVRLLGFLRLCGLLGTAKDDPLVVWLTHRWWSLVDWLARRRDLWRTSPLPRDQADDPVVHGALRAERLAVKAIDFEEDEERFCESLAAFFASDQLQEFLDTAQGLHTGRVPAGSVLGLFRRLFIVLAESGLLKTDRQVPADREVPDVTPWHDEDTLVFRVCRASVLPLACLIRMDQPYPLHLLVLAMNYRSDHPSTLTYATIAGRIPVPCNKSTASGDRQKWFHFVAMYWSFFTGLSSAMALDTFDEQLRRIWERIGENNATNVMLQTIAHTIVQPIAGARRDLEECLRHPPASIFAVLPKILSALRRAYMASQCVELLVRGEEWGRKWCRGKSAIFDVLDDVRNDREISTSEGGVQVEWIGFDPKRDIKAVRVEGSDNAWFLVFWSLLRNARQESPDGRDVIVRMILQRPRGDETLRIEIENAVDSSLYESK